MELAELAIRIDSRDAKNAEADLKRLADTGTHTERSLEGVGEGGKEAARGSDAAARSSREAAAAMDRHAEAARRVTSAVRYFAAASVAAGAAAATWMLSMSRSMDATQKMAEQIGVTTEALTGMRFAAQQFANISDQTFDMSMRRMTRRIEEAAQGGGAAKAAIEGLGFSAKELARLSPDRQMLAIADAMQRTESQARRLQYAMAIFDTEGMPLVAALQQGSAAFDENIRLAQRYGVVLSTEAAQAAADFQTEVSRLHAIVSGFSLDIANQVLPTLNRFINNAIEAATKVDGLHSEVKELTRDSAFKDWFDASLVGLARVADVAVAVAKSIGVVGLAFKAAAADVQAGLAWLAKPNAADKLLMPAEEYQRLVDEYDAAMSHQKNTVERFNAALDNLLNYQGNRFEQAAIRAINTITVTSDKITTVDLTVGGDSAGASEEQLKKLAEWTERLATPTEKLEMTLARAKAELGSLYTPEIERRIRAQYAAQQSGNKVLTEAQRIQQAFERERQQSLRTQRAAISAIHEEARGIEDQVALYGLSRTAIEDLTIARLEEQAALLSGRAGAEEQLEIFEREIEARKRLRTAIGSMEQKEAERAAWEDWSRDVEQIFQQVGQSLTDAIFEGGKSARDLVKDLFKTLTLRVLVQPVMTGLQGLFMGAGPAGIANAAGAGGGMMGNASSLFSMFGGNSMGMGISNALTNLSSSSMLAGTGVGNWMTGVAGNVAGMSNLALGGAGLLGGLGAGLLFDNKGYSSAGGGLGATAGMALGGPVGAIAGSLLGGALGSLFGDDEPRTRHAQMSHADLGADGTFSVSTWDDRQSRESQIAAAAYATEAVRNATELFGKIGIDAAFTRFTTLMESSILGDKQGVGSSGTIRIGDLEHEIGLAIESSWTKHGVGGWSEAEMLPRLMTDVQLTILEAFQAAGDQLPSVLSGMLEGVDIRALGAEQAQELAQRFQLVVDQVSAFQSALEQLPFASLRDLTFDVSAAMISALGGIESANAALSSYFDNFYSQEEKLDWLSQQISGSLAAVGLVMPDVTQGADAAKQAFRELFESIDPLAEGGAEAKAAMLGVNQQFHELVTGLDQLSEATRRAADEALAAARKEEARRQAAWAAVADRKVDEALAQLQAAYSTVQRFAQQEISRLQQTFSTTDSLWSAYQSRVRSLESELGNLLTTISRGVADLRGQVEATARMQYNQARAVISTAVLTGQLPQSADLTEAMRIAQQGVANSRYASAFDEREAYLKLAAELEALQSIAQPELDAAQATLEQLEKQYNKLRGIESLSEKSLSQLERQLIVAFSAEEAARVQIVAIEAQLAWAERQYNALLGIDTSIDSLSAAMRAFSSAVSNVQQARKDAELVPGSKAWEDAYLKAKQAELEQGRHRPQDYTGRTVQDLRDYITAGHGMSVYEHYLRYGRNENIPGFDVGTSYVPHDMTANIHKGEIIIDPRSSDILRRYGIGVQGGGSNRETEQLLREQLAEVRQQNRYLYEIVKSGKRTANNTEDTAMAIAHGDSDGVVVVM